MSVDCVTSLLEQPKMVLTSAPAMTLRRDRMFISFPIVRQPNPMVESRSASLCNPQMCLRNLELLGYPDMLLIIVTCGADA